MPAYGPEMRGGSANCSVVISDEPIGSPKIEEPDVVIAMNRPSMEQFEPMLVKGGTLIYNTSLIDVAPRRDDIRAVPVDCLTIARELGITELLRKYPYEVSGGQKQRAAVARAIITDPKLVLADEPTGALDSKATDELLRLFGQINADGHTVLMVTHSVKAASHANRVLFIKDGEVFHQIYRGTQTNEQLYQKISDTLTMLATGGDRI